MTDEARDPSPVEVVGAELERLGVRRFDPKSWLLGYLIGREWPLTDDELRRHVRQLYERPSKKKG